MSKIKQKKNNSGNKPAKPSISSTQKSITAQRDSSELLYGKETYIWIAGGFLLVLLGLALMSGGRMPDLNTWDDNIIYSFRRTVLAPVVILAGLALEIYVIFRK